MAFWLRTHNNRRAHNDFDALMGHFGALLRELEPALTHQSPTEARRGFGPKANLFDDGDNYVIRAAVPGLKTEDIHLSAHHEGLTLKAESSADAAPEGYSAHRQERAPAAFSRSFAFPTRIDADKIEAVLRHGILHITVPKAAAEKPRQIQVRVG